MKHNHYEIGVAKLENTELCVFYKLEGSSRWESTLKTSPQHCFYEQNDYFLCLPQHKEACLHWLNGGELQINRKGHGFLDWDRPSREWKAEVSFMFDINEFRIKPKKEKRWLRYNSKGVLQNEYIKKPDCANKGDQLIEIEVEV